MTKMPVIWPGICMKWPVLVVDALTEYSAAETLIIVSYLKSCSVLNYFLCYLAMKITFFCITNYQVFRKSVLLLLSFDLVKLLRW